MTDIFDSALASSRSVIVFGNWGRRPFDLQFQMDHRIDSDGVFLFDESSRRRFRMVVEPTFGASVPAGPKTIVFSSHLYLDYDPERVAVIESSPPFRSDGFPRFRLHLLDDGEPVVFVPPVDHPWPAHLYRKEEENRPILLDFVSGRPSVHRVYLSLLTFLEACPSEVRWSWMCPRETKRALSEILPLALPDPDDPLRKFLEKDVFGSGDR